MSLSDASQPEVDFLQSLIGSGFAQSFGQMVSVRLLTCVAQLHTLYSLFSLVSVGAQFDRRSESSICKPQV